MRLMQSGIGVGGRPKEWVSFSVMMDKVLTLSYSTAFGLYRDGTELRGVYSSKRDVARTACASLGTQCDFPILMGACTLKRKAHLLTSFCRK